MRKEITIVGVGARRNGVSNSGKAYDFTPIAFTFPSEVFDGVEAHTVNVSQDCMGKFIPMVGDVVEAVMHSSNFRIYVDAIL